MDMDIDFSIQYKKSVIVERKLQYHNHQWRFSSPKRRTYKKLLSEEYLHLLKQLQENVKEQIIEDTDSGIDTASVATGEVSFWEPPPLKVGDIYLAPGREKWTKAKLVKIRGDKTLELVKIRIRERLLVDESLVGHLEPPRNNNYFQKGTRVLAASRNIAPTGEISSGRRVLERGVVAEYPCQENRWRYLVIFDTGKWAYMDPSSVWGLHYQSKKIWRVLRSPVVKSTVKDYLTGKYEKGKVEYQKNDLITTEAGDNIVVMHVDASLLLLWYQEKGMSEWVHKASPRLKFKPSF